MAATPLISAEQLHEWLMGPADIVLLDVRWSLDSGALRSEYEHRHIPTARFVDLDSDLSAEPGSNGRHPLPDHDRFVEAMQRLGVNTSSTVVCYDGQTSSSAARAWWLLRYFGHREAYVLDGGLAAWTRSGYGTQEQQKTYARGDFVARDRQIGVLEAGEVLEFAATHTLLDARAPERYDGRDEPVDAVAGHIPGAVNAPATQNLETDGTFLPRAQLQNRFHNLGVCSSTPVGVYCGSGVTAANQVLALETAGFTASLYPGSWSEWISDASRPIETGASPAHTDCRRHD